MDLFVRNVHKKFSAYIAECYKTKSQHPAKADTRKCHSLHNMGIVQIPFEEVETMVSYPLRLPIG